MSRAAAEATAALAELAAALAHSALSPATEICARQRLFDTLGAVVVGLHTPEGALLEEYARTAQSDAPSQATLCRLYVGAARATEIDDIDVSSCTTVGSVVVPAALAAAALVQGGERAVLAAIAAGYEAMIRLGRAIGGATLLYRGVWPTYVTAAFGAAAAAARVLALDAAATARALALALTRTAPLPPAAVAQRGFRYYALGCAATDGLDAAFAAAAGIGADLDALEGYGRRVGVELDSTQLATALGSARLVAAVDTKTWPTSRQALASVAAFQRLAPETRVPSEIAAITVHVPAHYRNMVDRAALPANRIESMIGVQYQLALAALTPEKLYDALRSHIAARAEVVDFMSKIEVRADDALSNLFPQRWGSRVVLRLRSGAEVTSEVLEPDGSAARPLGWDALERKLARICAASGIDVGGTLPRLRALCERAGLEAAAVQGLQALLHDVRRAAPLERGEAHA